MEVKDVRNLQKELSKAVAEMVISFEAETGCQVDGFYIQRTPKEPWNVIIDVTVEI
ncbi:MAG: hypothetical protein ACYSSM_06135 [Planctomycetota bacterium]|jgi:hypothetical protein